MRYFKINKPLSLIALMVVLAISSTSLLAEEVSYKELQKIQKTLESEKKQLNTLDRKKTEIEKDLSRFRQRMIMLNEKIRSNEKDLSSLQAQRQKLEAQKSALVNSLTKNKKQKQNLLMALQRLSIEPPIATLLDPSAHQQKARKAILLNALLPQLTDKANNLSDKFEELRKIEASLNKQQGLEEGTHHKIQDQYGELKNMLDQRARIFRKSNLESSTQKNKVNNLSQKASSLQELINSLEKTQQDLLPRPKKGFSFFSPNTINKMMLNLTLPIQGKLLHQYGDTAKSGLKIQGIQLEANSKTAVVAPLDGDVLFVGPFRNYGNIIIIRHENEFNSLIAGFEQIDSFVGQKVITGEPLGTVNDINTEKKIIYYELRHKGAPINPIHK